MVCIPREVTINKTLFQVTETDTLPIHICYQCASTLIAWHDLVISCVEADKKLKELQVEDEDDDDDKGAEVNISVAILLK